MEIQWFPGHMTKAKNLIEEYRRKIDVFLEIVDARAPQSCRNPLLGELIANKPRLVILNKIDLADHNVSDQWKRYFEAQPDTAVLLVSSKEKKNLTAIPAACRELCANKKGVESHRLYAMIVGIPNVGKSTLINALAGGHKAAVAPKPGHTRGVQRIKITETFELLDSPGILWHKFDDPAVGMRLAMLGSIKDDIYDFHGLTLETIAFLQANYPKALVERYKIDPALTDGHQILAAIGRRRGCLMKGGEIDLERACLAIMTDLRTGDLGRFSLEKPPARGLPAASGLISIDS